MDGRILVDPDGRDWRRREEESKTRCQRGRKFQEWGMYDVTLGGWGCPVRMQSGCCTDSMWEMEGLFRSNPLQDSNGVYENEA